MRLSALETFPARPLLRQPYPTLERLIAPTSGKDALLAAAIVHSDARFVDPRLRALPMPPSPEEVAAACRDKKAVTRVTDTLVALAHREDATLTVHRDGHPIHCTQSSGHMELRDNAFVLVPGQTLSSKPARREMAGDEGVVQQYNANLTVAKIDGRSIVVGSGRSDWAPKIEELLAFGATHAPGAAQYHAAIITAMDYSPVKNIVSRLVGLEDESLYLRRQQQSIAALFPDTDARMMHLADGRTVHVHKPLRFNLIFSEQARNPINLWLARRGNRDAAVALFDRFATVVRHPALSDAMRDALTLEAKEHCLSRVVPLLADELAHDDVLACSALALLITGKDLDGNRHLNPTGPAMELLLLGQLLKRCGITPHVQCKSGQDRKLAMESVLVASELFGLLRADAVTSPAMLHANKGDQCLMQWLFTQVADKFGEQHIRYVRGMHGAVKWGMNNWFGFGKPVPRAWYLPYHSRLGVRSANNAFTVTPPLTSRVWNWLTSWRARAAGYAPLP